MKKMIMGVIFLWVVALILLLVVVFSGGLGSCDGSVSDDTTTGISDETTPVTTAPAKPQEPVYDTDDGWGPLIPMKPVK